MQDVWQRRRWHRESTYHREWPPARLGQRGDPKAGVLGKPANDPLKGRADDSLEEAFLTRRFTNGHKAHEKTDPQCCQSLETHIASRRNAPPHPRGRRSSGWPSTRVLRTCRNQNPHILQLLKRWGTESQLDPAIHSWAQCPRELETCATQKPVCKCSQQRHSKLPKS